MSSNKSRYNFRKYYKSRENRGAMVIIPIGLEIFRIQNTNDSKNYMILNYTRRNLLL